MITWPASKPGDMDELDMENAVGRLLSPGARSKLKAVVALSADGQSEETDEGPKGVKDLLHRLLQ